MLGDNNKLFYLYNTGDTPVHKATYFFHSKCCDINFFFINSDNNNNSSSNKFLIGSEGSLLFQFDATTISYQDTYSLIYKKDTDIIFNRPKTIMALYYKKYSLVVFSLKHDCIISSSKYL